jgi:glycine oxidase
MALSITFGTAMHVRIKGAGIIGLSIGWKLLREGYAVDIYDTGQAGRGASWAAAGMLGPYAEARVGDEALTALGEASLALYPQFLQELSEDCGRAISFESQGTLVVGIDQDDKVLLEHAFHEKAILLHPEQAREIEPLLSPRITSALWIASEWQIDNRRLIDALIAAFVRRGGVLHEYTTLPEERSMLLINAAGSSADPRIRPNKGQILTLSAPDHLRLSHVVRSPRVYLAPKSDGSLRVGASSEDVGYLSQNSAGKVRELLNDAAEIVPAMDEMPFQEALFAFRPMTEDRLPLIEEKESEILAAGHGRCGILLAPYTAQKVIDLIRRK